MSKTVPGTRYNCLESRLEDIIKTWKNFVREVRYIIMLNNKYLSRIIEYLHIN